jgi:hypothetical protein
MGVESEIDDIDRTAHESLVSLSKRIQPVMAFRKVRKPTEGGFELIQDGITHHYVETFPDDKKATLLFVDQRDLSQNTFLIDPKPLAIAKDLIPLAQITTYHTGDFFFKPSAAEVLEQIPDDYLEKTVAYLVNSTDDLIALGGIHEVTTQLYTKHT